jgi:chlorite dismutase
MDTIAGALLEPVARVEVINGDGDARLGAGTWRLRGVTSNQRYTNRVEHERLVAAQPILGRPEASCAALIPIRKTDSWWTLPQDERRTILEERSAHIKTGLAYLPAIARRLHHCRDLGEPFDFLTWFEYAPASVDAFEHLLQILRATEEWAYVEREIDIRLIRVE